MTQIKKTKSEIFVIFSSEIRKCRFFYFSWTKNRAKKGPLYYVFDKTKHWKYLSAIGHDELDELEGLVEGNAAVSEIARAREEVERRKRFFEKLQILKV